MSIPCIERDQLLCFLNGRVADSQRAEIENHLTECRQCHDALELLADESDSFVRGIADAIRDPYVAEVFGAELIGGQKLSSQVVHERGSLQTQNDAPSGETGAVKMIRDYQLLECIGQGGMGTVYRALDVRLSKYVAVKILRSERRCSIESLSRFEREMKLLARLDVHEQIVQAYGAGEHEGLPYFVMEYVSGVNLQQLVRRLGPLPVAEACSIARLTASALQFAHEKNVIHRDVKPSNVMLTSTGNVKLLDLGLAQVLENDGGDALSRSDQALGTLKYMPPEQRIGNPVTRQSDIYSLGVTLLELLTGVQTNVGSAHAPHLVDVQAARPDVCSNLVALLRDMLAIKPSLRPDSMRDVESRLLAIAPATALTSLMAEYYRWPDRNVSSPVQDHVKAETTEESERTTDGPLTRINERPMTVAAEPLTAQANDHYLTRWGKLTGLFSVAGVALWMAIAMSAKPTTVLQVSTSSHVVPQLVEEGLITVEEIATGKRYELTLGQMKLPAGKYRLGVKGPKAFQEDGQIVEVFPSGSQRIRLNATLTKAFQFPELPDVGANATYHGSIWHAGWGESQPPIPFGLYMEVLAHDNPPGLPATKWLKIEFHNQREGYTETAYLKLDAGWWDKQCQLEILEGWVVAKSAAIEKYLAKQGQNGLGKELVMKFDHERDLLAEIESAPIPTQRLSVQDVITLFFGMEMNASAESVRTARALLSTEETHQWLGTTRNAMAPVLCYIISSRTREEDDEKDGYRLALRTADEYNPFGFVELQVKTDFLRADCKMKHASVQPLDRLATDNMLVQIRQSEFKTEREKPMDDRLQAGANGAERDPFSQPRMPAHGRPKSPRAESRSNRESIGSWIATPLAIYDFVRFNLHNRSLWPEPSRERPWDDAQAPITNMNAESTSGFKTTRSTERFDLAKIPAYPSEIIFQGSISTSNTKSETITATARMLGTQILDGRNYSWIEVEINSMIDGQRDHWEAARVLVDTDEYHKSQTFLINRGWVAYKTRDNVFSIPADGSLEKLIDLRLQLQEQLQSERIGVVDVLSMLFDAKLKPNTRISSLRATIAGMLSGRDRVSTPALRKLTFGGELSGEIYIPPKPLAGQLNYEFFRCNSVPFGFASVELFVRDLSIKLEVKNQGSPTDFSKSVFGTPTQLSQLQEENERRCQPVHNWRVWTWGDEEVTYKSWAEFGGVIPNANGPDILLRDKKGREVRVPQRLLSTLDIESINKGRYWQYKKDPRRLLTEDKGNELWFIVPSTGKRVSISGAPFAEVDQLWLSKLRNAYKVKPPMDAKAWQVFAGYLVR